MPFAIELSEEVIPLTVGGTTTGYVTISADYVLYPGTRVTLWSNGGIGDDITGEFIVTSSKNGLVGLRAAPTSKTDQVNNLNFGRTDVSAYLVADSAKMMVHRQIVRVSSLARPWSGI